MVQFKKEVSLKALTTMGSHEDENTTINTAWLFSNNTLNL